MPPPLLAGRNAFWCAGVAHVIGAANFLLDASQSPHCSAATIADHFGVATSTSHNHANKVRDLLKITPFSPRWWLLNLLKSSQIPWILEVDGYLRDIRSLPLEIQPQTVQRRGKCSGKGPPPRSTGPAASRPGSRSTCRTISGMITAPMWRPRH